MNSCGKRSDMEQIYNRLVRENESYYQHTDEGSDDMPSHAKCSLTGVSLTIPVTGGKLNLGTWQGIYLCEFRDYGGPRRIVATIMGQECSDIVRLFTNYRETKKNLLVCLCVNKCLQMSYTVK